MRTRFEFDFHTRATPAQVVELLTDFSPDRPKRWPALSPTWFEVYSVGTTEADVREGQDKPVIWAREHYDWSAPGTVTWTVVESNALAPGSTVSLTVKASSDGGSDVHGVWDRTAANTTARMVVIMMKFAGPKILRGYFTKVYDALADAA